MGQFDIYCEGHKMATIFADDGIEAMHTYFARISGRELADEYVTRATREADAVKVQISYYTYLACRRL